jgi:Spy/CpxP family protein refolding chaperone
VNAWKVILATIVIFGTGVITGALVFRQTQTINAPAQHKPLGPGRPPLISAAGDLRLEFLRRAQRELDLNPDQRERIEKMIKDSQERTRKLMEPVAPEIHAELQRTKDQFLEVLTPEQRIRFERFIKRRPHESKHKLGTP